MNKNLTTADANAAVVKHVAQHIDDILFGDINAPMTEEETFVELSRILTYYGMPTETVEECACLLYTSPSPRDQRGSRMPSSA